MDSTQPHFLLAMPELNDPNFDHGVVMMINHNKEGAIGLLVNKPTELTLGEFAESKGEMCHSNLKDVPVFLGGPVERDHGWILHCDESIEEKQVIIPGVFLSGTQKTLKALLEKGHIPTKLILGYAGWSAHQLEDEMKTGAWLSTEIEKRFLFWPNHENTWRDVLKNKGIDPEMLSSVNGVQ